MTATVGGGGVRCQPELPFGSIAITWRSPLSPEQPQYHAEHQADQQGGPQRQIQAEVLPLDHDVAGQPTQPDLLQQRPEQPGGHQNQTNDDQEACRFVALLLRTTADMPESSHGDKPNGILSLTKGRL